MREWNGRLWQLSISREKVAAKTRRRSLEVLQSNESPFLILKKGLFSNRLHGPNDQSIRFLFVPSVVNSEVNQQLRLFRFLPRIQDTVDWSAKFSGTLADFKQRSQWIPKETIDPLILGRPKRGLFSELRDEGLLEVLLPEELEAVGFLEGDHLELIEKTNQEILTREKESYREFFNSIESQPLTEEQIEAVVCFDNRVRVVAAAGSGKTSLMVARAAYAVKRGFVNPQEILLLAFNRAAARELQERVDTRFKKAGLDPSMVRASTFHSFGLTTIGQISGRKPRLAPWVSDGLDVSHLGAIVERLKEERPEFAISWEAYRLLLADAPTAGPDVGTPQWWNKEKQRSEFFAFDGTRVKSYGEMMIANWLFLNEVEYIYEKRYNHDLANSRHGEYRPDFYYPAADVWHEHWALGADGKPPKEWTNYQREMQWKRRVHRQNKTTLIETDWHNIVFGTGLSDLRDRLRTFGIEFKWNPKRVPPTASVIDHAELISLMRSFLSHVKSNGLNRENIAERLATSHSDLAGFRTEQFLKLFWSVYDEWQSDLETSGYVDFDDMLIRASDEIKEADSPLEYKLILVDELQDASHARAELVRSLLHEPGRYLLAVGDDWQSVNRFAGAEIAVMTDFHEWFGEGRTLFLRKSFRTPGKIAQPAADFVSKNPKQIPKEVVALDGDSQMGIVSYLVDFPGWDQELKASENFRAREIAARKAVEETLKHIDLERERAQESVLILGRFGFQGRMVPQKISPALDVRFSTVHSSKGTEADHVVLLGLDSGRHGFPSEMADDPVLSLAMTSSDPYEHAEERRLFYVALTRARRSVVLLADRSQPSQFLAELLTLGRIGDLNGEILTPCVKCGKGLIFEREGRAGGFLSCTRFPQCR